MNAIVTILLACALSWGLTALLRHYALKKNLLDVPNARSSHAMPTPRGGGMAIVITFLIAIVSLGWFDAMPPGHLWAMAGAGALVALIGFLDDHGHIPARWRLLAHSLAAIWAVAWLGGLTPVMVLDSTVDLGWEGDVLAVLFLVWLLNLYNFMDGIDGIAGVEAITVCLGAVTLSLFSAGSELREIYPELFLIAAVAGFLAWNFPRAKIFMGDAGSGFLGITLGILSIQAAWQAPQLFWAWLILLGAFIVDATVTLIRRIVRGERFYEAHRSHAYQYAAHKYGSHVPVTLAFGAINLFWLLPVAAAVVSGWMAGILGLLVAYLPLVILAYHFKAGVREGWER